MMFRRTLILRNKISCVGVDSKQGQWSGRLRLFCKSSAHNLKGVKKKGKKSQACVIVKQ